MNHYNELSIRRSQLSDSVKGASPVNKQHVLVIQLIASFAAGISLVSGLVVIYLFVLMQKSFRHTFIMLVITADLFRSIWLFIFPVVSFARGTIPTETVFCQAGGYFIQMSFEMTDFATLLIAVHTALQVFRPKPSVLGPGGLYEFRHTMCTLFCIIPASLAALAFTHGKYAYLSQGPICSLPIRPFWYRLATAWIPRYLVILTCVTLYLAIYIHAEHQFTDSKLFHGKLAKAMRRMSDSRKKDRPSSSGPEMPTVSRPSSLLDQRERANTGESAPVFADSVQPRSQLSSHFGSIATTRHDSAATAGTGQQLLGHLQLNAGNGSLNPSTEGPLQEHMLATTTTDDRGSLGPTTVGTGYSQTSENIEAPFEVETMRKKRNAIRRQLRLLFIYPIVHFIMWLGPLAQHISLYSSKTAANPIYALGIWTYLSIGILGFVDALVFCLREKPWRHIPGSDDTLLGALAFWRQDFSERAQAARRIARSGTNTSRRDSSAGVSPTRRLSTVRRESVVSTRGRHSLDQAPTVVVDTDPALRRPSNTGIQGMAAWDFGTSRNDVSVQAV